MENNNTQPQAFYTKIPSATGNSSENNSASNNKPKSSPRKKSHIKTILGVVVLLIVLLGSGAGFYLSQQNQDLRQQANEGDLAELGRCETCLDPSRSRVSAVCSAGLVCKTTSNETCSTPTDGTEPICTSVASAAGVCLLPEEAVSSCNSDVPAGCHYEEVQCFQAPCDPVLVCDNEVNPGENCVTHFSVPKGNAICESKIAQSDFTPTGTQVVESFTDPGQFNVGDQFVFSITVTSANDTDGDVVVTDELPSNLKFIENLDNTPGIIITQQQAFGTDIIRTTVNMNLGEMAKDETTKVEFMVEVISENVDPLVATTNSAKITTNNVASTESICSYNYNTVLGTAECVSKEMYDIDPTDPDAELIPAGSALTRGEEYVYYITVKATNKTSAEIKVTDLLPRNLEFVKALPNSEQYISHTAGEDTVDANLGILEDEEVTLGFVVKVIDQPTLGEFTNYVNVSQQLTDITEEVNTCEVTHTILPIGTAQCVEKEAFTDFDGNEIEAGEVVDPGQEFIYRISVQADDTTTGDVVVVDELSANLIFVDDPDNTTGIEYDLDTREVSFNYGVITDDEVKTLEFKVQVIASPTGTTVDNSATITTNDDTSHVCEISLELETEEVEYACNESCTSNEDCQSVNENYICHDDSSLGFVCRLDTNYESTSCSLATTPTPSPTPTPTPAPGCNDLCSTNADCSNSAHVCTTVADGSNRCRLDNYPDSATCTVPMVATTQPELPEILPETGPADWLNWLKAGMVTLGVGTALLLLL